MTDTLPRGTVGRTVTIPDQSAQMFGLTDGLATESLPRGRRRILSGVQHIRRAVIMKERADRDDRITLPNAFGHRGGRGGKVLHRRGVRIGTPAVVDGLRTFAQHRRGSPEKIALCFGGRRPADL